MPNTIHLLSRSAAIALGCCAAPGVPAAAPAMIRIAPGSFIAGSTQAETDAVHYPAINAAREQPARRVTIAYAFAIGRTEVTRGQFARFVTATRWSPDGPCSFFDAAGNAWATDRAHDWQHPGFAQTDRHPVVCVNFDDAQAYARWLSKATGRRFRLPTGDEWEYAARAGTATPHWWGTGGNETACRFANIFDDTLAARIGGKVDRASYFPCRDGMPNTAPVGSFRRSPWGLHDTLGNVWEWTLDCLRTDATEDCASHIDRGASWGNTVKYVRAAARHPDLTQARTAVLGFRLIEDLR